MCKKRYNVFIHLYYNLILNFDLNTHIYIMQLIYMKKLFINNFNYSSHQLLHNILNIKIKR